MLHMGEGNELMEAIRAEHIRVEDDRIVFEVRVADPRLRRTTPAIAARAVALRPNLPRHACVNAVGSTFAAVMDDTPLPHLLEHVVIDMLVEASEDANATYVGASRWTCEPEGEARVQVSMDDDLAVLRAFNRALAFVNSVVDAPVAPESR